MKYTVLYAHLAKTYVKKGQILNRGDVIGKQGNTGESFGEHLHIAVVNGTVPSGWSLDQAVPGGKYEPNRRQLDFFFGSDLYNPKADPNDKSGIKMGNYGWGSYSNHYAYDTIRGTGGLGPDIYWNRSMPGEVLGVYDHRPNGKGIFVVVGYNGSYVAPKGKVGTINFESVNKRKTPSLTGDVVGSVKKGGKVTVVDTVRDNYQMTWYKLSDGSYLKSDFVNF